MKHLKFKENSQVEVIEQFLAKLAPLVWGSKHFPIQLINPHKFHLQMSRDMRLPTMWHVRPARPQISLRIRAV